MSSSDGKPGIFARLRRAITSTIDDAVDAVSDPGQEIALMLDDLAAQIRQAEQDHKQALVDKKVLERKAESLRADEKAWTGRAEQALRAGDETLARAALARRLEIADQRGHTETSMVEQTKLVEDMGEHLQRARLRLKQLNLKRGTLMAQARASKHGGDPGDPFGGNSPLSKLDEIEGKISELEALNEVHASMNDERVEEARIDARLRALSAETGGGDEIDDQLAELKAKMRAKALGPSTER